MLAAGPAQAQNLLVNPGFESPPSGQVVASGWTYFAPPTLPAGTKDYWVVTEASANGGVPPHSGTYYWKEWGALYNSAVSNVAGIYQTFSSTPGSNYQASGWFATSASDKLGAHCYTWLQVEFLDASSNLLALYKSGNFSASVGTSTWFQYQVTNACDLTQPVATGDPYFTTYAVTGSVNQLVAPLPVLLFSGWQRGRVGVFRRCGSGPGQCQYEHKRSPDQCGHFLGGSKRHFALGPGCVTQRGGLQRVSLTQQRRPIHSAEYQLADGVGIL
jgi:hypothetical protein